MTDKMTQMTVSQYAIDRAIAIRDASAADAHRLGALTPTFAADILILPEFNDIQVKPEDVARVLEDARDPSQLVNPLALAEDELKKAKPRKSKTREQLTACRYTYATLLMAKAFFEGIELLNMVASSDAIKAIESGISFWHWAQAPGSQRLQPWLERNVLWNPRVPAKEHLAGDLEEAMDDRLPHEVYKPRPANDLGAFQVCGPSRLERVDNPFVATEHTMKTFMEVQQLKERGRRQLYRHQIISRDGEILPSGTFKFPSGNVEQDRLATELVEEWLEEESNTEEDEGCPWSWEVKKSRDRSLVIEPEMTVSIEQRPPKLTGKGKKKEKAEARKTRVTAEDLRERRMIAFKEQELGVSHGTLLSLRDDPFPPGMRNEVKSLAAARAAATLDGEDLLGLADTPSEDAELDEDDIISRFCRKAQDNKANLAAKTDDADAERNDLYLMSGALPRFSPLDGEESSSSTIVQQNT
ncbi:hypothetical protein LTR36_009189 [Oleoguttula mirabilis]|uniref:Uncharacterized protein n=1 Tax=Oleoguttula mirabilis TaxID=1507867 RepID=A0AAV9J694_9PEZI|nr:hypothetical protein LTR36_009189 [Oleoguttula mirabilis]